MTEISEVFLVHHIRQLQDDVDEVKFVGVFSTQEYAQSAVNKLKDQVGFRDFVDGFSIEAHKLNRIGWSEGFEYDR
jgi:homoserine kinase type II